MSNRHGSPPLSEQALLNSANFTLSILPCRLAHRIQSLRNLPFIVVTNPHISKIHNNYVHSLSTLLPWAEREITNLEDEIKFTEVMADLVQTHNNTISILARGFLEARKYISPLEVTNFLDEHLRARIGTRLIAEQHIALHFSSKPHQVLSQPDGQEQENPDSMHHHSYIGVIDSQLSPAMIIRHCEAIVGDICEFKYGMRPRVIINGDPNYTFAHIPVHLEYIITELLKNAFRATIEMSPERCEPIEVTIAPLPEDPLASKASGTEIKDTISSRDQGIIDEASRQFQQAPEENKTCSSTASPNVKQLEHFTPGVTIRIRDRGGGISPEDYERIWEYSFTTFSEDKVSATLSGSTNSSLGGSDAFSVISGASSGCSSIAGLGYGLPLGRAYAEYFGGGIAVQSLWGWGTDVYLSLRGVCRID
jgi:signal transduction histidine kinase